MIDVAVLGAGISGLVAGYELKKRGLTVQIFDGSDSPGGMIRTVNENGYRLELGANSFLLRESGDKLVRELGLTPIEPVNKTRFLSLDVGNIEQLVSLSIGNLLGSKILSAKGKLRVLKEPLIAKLSGEDLSVHEFIVQRLGIEVADRMISPFFSGIYASNIRELSAKMTLQKFWKFERESGSILRGAARAALSRTVRPKIVSFDGGLQSFTDAIAKKLAGQIFLNTEIHSVVPTPGGVELHHGENSFLAKRVILSGDALSTSELLEPLEPAASERIAQIPYSPVGLIYVSCSSEQLRLNGVGFLRQPKNEDPLLGVLFSSRSFPGVAPKGRELLTCFVGGALNPELSEAGSAEVQRLTIVRLRKLLSISGELEIVQTASWGRAIPNFPVGHASVQEVVRKVRENHPALRFIGNWIEKPGVADCIERGLRAAGEVAAELAQ